MKNAQDAGAIAVLVADNVLGSIRRPARWRRSDDHDSVGPHHACRPATRSRRLLATQTVNVTLGLDLSILAGTDRVKGLMMVAALNPVAPGSSISHWDTAATRNQLMEPAINVDLTSSVTPPEDLTASQMTDIGWFSDGDGVPDGRRQLHRLRHAADGRHRRLQLEGGQRRPGERLHRRRRHQSVRDRPARTSRCTQLACVVNKTERLRKAKIITAKEAAGILVCTLLTLGH